MREGFCPVCGEDYSSRRAMDCPEIHQEDKNIDNLNRIKSLERKVDRLWGKLIEAESLEIKCTCGWGGEHSDFNENCERSIYIKEALKGE